LLDFINLDVEVFLLSLVAVLTL